MTKDGSAADVAEQHGGIESAPTAVRRWSKFLVFSTFLLLMAGALVTGNKAALSDPTWPTFVGHWWPKYFQGGLIYEDTHRLIAGTVGIFTLLMALLVQFKDNRGYLKKLAWFAVALVAVQAGFGALIILLKRIPYNSWIHGVLAQLFFCNVVALSVYCSRVWTKEYFAEKINRPENASYIKLMKVLAIILFVQVVLGGGVRHSNDTPDARDLFMPFIIAHISGAFVVILSVIWFNLRTFQVYGDVKALTRTALGAAGLVGVQIFLGTFAIFANRARIVAELPEYHHVIISTAHLLTGACLLALIFGMYLRSRNLLAVQPDVQTLPSGNVAEGGV